MDYELTATEVGDVKDALLYVAGVPIEYPADKLARTRALAEQVQQNDVTGLVATVG